MPWGDSTLTKLLRKALGSPNLKACPKTTKQPDGGQVGRVVLGMLVTRCPSSGYNIPVHGNLKTLNSETKPAFLSTNQYRQTNVIPYPGTMGELSKEF